MVKNLIAIAPTEPHLVSIRQTTSHLPDQEKQALIEATAHDSAPAANRSGYASRLPSKIGRYNVVTLMAEGRASRLYLGTIVGIGGVERAVAIKVLRPDVVGMGFFTRSFLHEERVSSALSHPGLVTLLDSGTSEHGHFMAFEYIRGLSVAELLPRIIKTGQLMPIDVAATIVHALAGGLHYLHELTVGDGQPLGLLHRDIHPGNVMIREDGFVKLIDFGEVTMAGMERAKPAQLSAPTSYTPPEAITQQGVDRRGDIYSLGVLLYTLTTGAEPQRASYIQTSNFIPPSAIRQGYPAGMERLVSRMLAPDPEQRFATAAAVQRALEELADTHALSLSPRLVARYIRSLKHGFHSLSSRALSAREHGAKTRRALSDMELTQPRRRAASAG